MCERTRPRYLCLYHVIANNDIGFTALDHFLESNVPDEYRVVGVTADKIVTDTVVMSYTIVLESIDG